MKELVDFFYQAGKLKRMERRGWVIRGIKNPETIAEHTFRVALMAWILGEKHRLNIEKIIKMALIHDLCEVYAGDTTPYDSILPKDKKKALELTKTWPRFSEKERQRLNNEKHKKEKKALEKITEKLQPKIKSEIMSLLLEYEKGVSHEGRFFRQTDRVENFMQAMEYWKKYRKPPQGAWWMQARELFDDPVLLKFIKEMEKKFYKGKKPKI